MTLHPMPDQYFYPPPMLQEFISAYFLSSYDTIGFEHTPICVYPTGSAVLCFSLDKPFIFKEMASGLIIRHTKFNFVHQFREPRFYQVIACPSKVLHVVFKPYGAYRLLGIPQNSSFDRHGTALTDILTDRVKDLLHQIEDASSNAVLVVKLVNEWLKAQFIKHEKISVGRVSHACKLIVDNRGNLSIEQLAQEVWLSKRALEYQFQEQVGLSPKMYCRITRFNALLTRIQNDTVNDFQELVDHYNYFDQAHLIKEFKFFSGNPPTFLPETRVIVS